MLSQDTKVQNLPILPHLHNGRFEKVLLVRDERGERWVFRLWPTDIQLKDTGEPLWVGTVEIQGRHRIGGLITVARDKGDYVRPLEILSRLLSKGFRLREVYRKNSEIHGDYKPDGLVWNGQALLAMETTR